jgi:hypothetical protein
MAAVTGLAAYRTTVTELLRAGQAFGEIEDFIDHVEDLSADEKAALWLYAFSLRDASEQQLEARAHLASVQ